MDSQNAANPLLCLSFPIPFDRIKPEHVEPAIRRLIAESESRKRKLGEASLAPEFDNTLRALDELTAGLDEALAVVKHLEGVATTAELRAAYNAIQPLATDFYAGIPLDEKIWNRIKEYAGSEEASRLSGVRRRYLNKTLESFRRHGAELGPDGKASLAAIEVELGRLTTKFAENVLDATNAFELVIRDERRLSGLPKSAIDAARQSAQQKGVAGWRFTLQEPSYHAVMTYLDDRGIREEVWRAGATRAAAAPYDNRNLLKKILDLRHHKAALVGYPNFSDYVLAERMAKDTHRAMDFLCDLEARTRPYFERENAELELFFRQLGGGELKPWDVAYVAEKLRRSRYDFDEEALRPYFPLAAVVAGMFEIARRLFGLRIMPVENVPVWDAQVRCYEIRDEDGTLLGRFYADWHPRENKRSGAWMDPLITGVETAEGLQPHVGAICGNLTEPVGSRPSLLTHREVETIFHEFGHLLHHCLSRVEIRSLAGTNVAWDFVELPSQIMENWCWEREALDLFARHYETGEPIPEDLFQKIKRARTFRSASAQMRQLGFGRLDFALHGGLLPPECDIVAVSRSILEKYSPVELPPYYAMVTSFTHLFADPVGYAAGYYSYKWAEVLDADAFTKFQQNGVFDRETGMLFRRTILSRGDSEDPAELFRAFMGREPSPEALMARLGLTG